MRSRLGLFTLILVATLAIAVGRPRELMPHVWTVDAGSCSVDFYSPPAQRRYTIALACPGVDYIRLWPLPPIRPWSEEDELPTPAPDLQQAKVSYKTPAE